MGESWNVVRFWRVLSHHVKIPKGNMDYRRVAILALVIDYYIWTWYGNGLLTERRVQIQAKSGIIVIWEHAMEDSWKRQ